MKTTVSLYDFRDAFQRMNRKENFTYEGLEALFEYLTDYEDSTGQETELDVIAICCDYAEYTADDLIKEFGDRIEIDEDEDGDESADRLAEKLREETEVIEVSNGNYILGAF